MLRQNRGMPPHRLTSAIIEREASKAIKGEDFDAADYDEKRAGRYAHREGFY
jgi:hypothetical protein